MAPRFPLAAAFVGAMLVGGIEHAASQGGEKEPPAAGIDYAGWTELTPKPVAILEEIFLRCESSAIDKLRAEKGPHAVRAVKYLASVDAAKALRDNPQAVLPAGGAIVKEKLNLSAKGSTLLAYAAMIKREKGYDPQHGDWEYLYADLTEEGKPRVERGKLESCIRCHALAKERDYLFRTHLGQPRNSTSR